MGSFLDLIDRTLGTDFNKPAYDPKKGRDKLVRVIDKAAEQHREGRTPPSRSWKTGHNDAVSFSPKLDGNPVLIQGEATNYVPAERFQEFLEGMKAAVQKGDLDDEIKAALGSDGDQGVSKLGIARQRATKGSSQDPNHPKFTDPKWSTYDSGTKIKAGMAYKNSKNG